MNLRIRELRESRDLRQIDVASATGIDQKTLSNYETGKTLPDIGSMCKLADFFHVTLDYLSGREPYNLTPNTDVKELFSLLESLNDAFNRIKKA